jgi:hypothetical protein
MRRVAHPGVGIEVVQAGDEVKDAADLAGGHITHPSCKPQYNYSANEGEQPSPSVRLGR